MNEEEFKFWFANARTMLEISKMYSEEEIEYILDFFSYIKTSRERELVGEEFLEKLIDLNYAKDISGMNCNEMLYHSLSQRLFIYAPYLARKYKKDHHGNV